MAEEPTGQWHKPSLASSYEGSSSSSEDESTSYEEEVVTPRPKKRGHMEEEEALTYTPERTGPSTRASHTLGQDNAHDEGRISI
jgi:hypothetical protein